MPSVPQTTASEPEEQQAQLVEAAIEQLLAAAGIQSLEPSNVMESLLLNLNQPLH